MMTDSLSGSPGLDQPEAELRPIGEFEVDKIIRMSAPLISTYLVFSRKRVDLRQSPYQQPYLVYQKH